MKVPPGLRVVCGMLLCVVLFGRFFQRVNRVNPAMRDVSLSNHPVAGQEGGENTPN